MIPNKKPMRTCNDPFWAGSIGRLHQGSEASQRSEMIIRVAAAMSELRRANSASRRANQEIPATKPAIPIAIDHSVRVNPGHSCWLVIGPVAIPKRTLRQRQPPSKSGPAQVRLSQKLYAMIATASATATVAPLQDGGIPFARMATPSAYAAATIPRASNAQPNCAALRKWIRPLDSGRSGRSRRSSSKSARSFSTMPAE